MINLQTILSSFDDKTTLLKWLKKVEKALAESVLEDVEVITIDATHIKLVFKFEDETEIETSSITLPRGLTGPKGETGDKSLLLNNGRFSGDITIGRVINLYDNAFNRLPVKNETFYQYGIDSVSNFTYLVGFNVDNVTPSVIQEGRYEVRITLTSAIKLTGEKGEPTDAPALYDLVSGSPTIVVDLDETGEKLEFHLDADVIDKIEKSQLYKIKVASCHCVMYTDKLTYEDFDDFVSNVCSIWVEKNIISGYGGSLMAINSGTNGMKFVFHDGTGTPEISFPVTATRE